MSEYVWTTFHIGGKVPTGRLAELKEIAGEYYSDVDREIDEAIKDGRAVFFEGKQNHGFAHGLEEFCRETGLTYQKAWDGASGCFGSGVEMYRPGDASPEEMSTNGESEAVMSAGELQRRLETGQSLADVVMELKRFDASNVPALTTGPTINEAAAPPATTEIDDGVYTGDPRLAAPRIIG